MARPERVEAATTQAGRPKRIEGQCGRQETNYSIHCKLREGANQRSRQQGKLTNNRERSDSYKQHRMKQRSGRRSKAGSGRNPKKLETRSHLAGERDSDRAREEDPTRAGPWNRSPRRREREAEVGQTWPAKSGGQEKQNPAKPQE